MADAVIGNPRQRVTCSQGHNYVSRGKGKGSLRCPICREEKGLPPLGRKPVEASNPKPVQPAPARRVVARVATPAKQATTEPQPKATQPAKAEPAPAPKQEPKAPSTKPKSWLDMSIKDFIGGKK